MKKILTEAFSVNLIIAFMLFALGAYSLKNVKSISAFADTGAIYKADTEEKKIALMINVYENGDIVEEYLEIFEKENVKATFFIGGSWAAKNKETVNKIHDKGHTLGNHGYNHKMHTRLDEKGNIDEISRTNALIKEITGEKCTLFAPPSGDVNGSVVACAEKCGCKTVMWSCDTIDWRDSDREKVFSRIKRNLKPGALILMHPKQVTLDLMEEIVSYIKNEGYSFETVDNLIK